MNNTELKPKNICRRCGRKLINEQSKAIGFGHICYKKYMEESVADPLFSVEQERHYEDTE